MSKLKAYTLMEILVALVISGLLISMASMLFLTIKKDVLEEQNRQEMGHRMLRLISFIEKDFDDAREITYNGGALKCFKKETSFSSYEFHNEYIIRRSQFRADSFSFKVNNIECNYLMDDPPMVAYFSFSILDVKGVEKSYNFNKEYTKSLLFDKTQQK